uniref:Uncharacterized protein n=1 Tax=Anguilla anguilla TaxID=7936 RepID=A0A0E9RWS4_ANGAN
MNLSPPFLDIGYWLFKSLCVVYLYACSDLLNYTIHVQHYIRVKMSIFYSDSICRIHVPIPCRLYTRVNSGKFTQIL